MQDSEVSIYTYGKLTKPAAMVTPVATDYVIDVDGMRDPQSNRGFKKTWRDGRPSEIQTYVSEDSRYNAILETVKLLTFTHLRSAGSNASWISFGLRDHHGIWIAPAVGELIADALSRLNYKVFLYHIDLEGRSTS